MRRQVVLGLISCGLALGGYALSRGLAEARQNAVVVVRFQLGYFDAAGHFVPTAGRGSTNVDRNAIAMFLFSGPIDTGPNTQATVPLTLAERDALEALQRENPDYDPETDGFELGLVPRRRSADRAAFYVATGSVNANSVIVGATQAGGTLAFAPGQYFKVLRPRGRAHVVANRLTFNPRYVPSVFDQPAKIDYNPQGLDASTSYVVYIDGGDNPINPVDLVRNLDGSPLAVPFFATFTTTTRYVQDYTRPQVRQTFPIDGVDKVESDADIELTFNEPMDVGSFITPLFQGDDAWTVNARYTTAAQNGLLQGRNLLLQVRTKPDTGGDVIQLRPLQGFGKGPYEIEVIVRNGVTDLSGNNIVRQINFTFKTETDPDADQAGFLEEKFDNALFRDTAFAVGAPEGPTGDNIVATWGGGFLSTSITSQQFTAQGPNPNLTAGFGLNVFGQIPLHIQNLFPTADLGARARTITGWDWQLSAGTYLGLSYPNCSVQIGHATDIIIQAGFPGTSTSAPGPSNSYFRDTPVLVTPAANYSTVGGLSGSFMKGPKFIQNFNSDGLHAVILDIAHNGSGGTGAQERWVLDTNYPLPVCTFNANLGAQIQTYPYYLTTRFTYLTPGAEAQSKFYDIGRDDERLLPQQLVPTSQPQGTSVTFLWQGANSDPLDPTKPDPTTYSPWVADVRSLSTSFPAARFLRFRVVMLNNLVSKAVPAIDTVTVPYTYK